MTNKPVVSSDSVKRIVTRRAIDRIITAGSAVPCFALNPLAIPQRAIREANLLDAAEVVRGDKLVEDFDRITGAERFDRQVVANAGELYVCRVEITQEQSIGVS